LNIFVTGAPGVGKTTVVQRTVETLERSGLKAGGFYCPELRSGDVRLGFEIVNVATGERGILAHSDLIDGPMVGHYRVNIEDLSRIAGQAIDQAIRSSDFIVIDEVGPMELKSEVFQRAVLKAVDGPKPVLGIIHRRADHSVVESIRRRGDVRILKVTPSNRDSLPEEIARRIRDYIEGARP